MGKPDRTAALIAAARTGDRAATEDLFLAFYPRVLKVAQVRIGSRLRNLFEPADIAQSVFGRAYQGLPRFVDRGPGSFAAWLDDILDCTIRDKARWLGARRRDGGAMTRLPAAMPGATSASPSRRAAEGEQLERLHRAMEGLSERERRAVELRMFLDLPWSEVAQALGASDEAARKTCSRAIEKVGRAIGGGAGRVP
ncbi:MAG: sigma-70 family RNA polymerase sigma factor [Planctomycetes bacterium]|nr:sigma-70 family RNA polymerase sigma factor [Planctomycetota bacterium]